MFCFAAMLFGVLGLASADWEQYKRVFNKNYSSDEESFRHGIFNESVARINAHNLLHDLKLTPYRMGLNHFADMTDDELKTSACFKLDVSNATGGAQEFSYASIVDDLPGAVDWRQQGYVTPVKNQKTCGSCWAFSATGSVEGQHFKATGRLVSLSEQNVIDCFHSGLNNGCSGGDFTAAFGDMQKEGGIDTEESYPYSAAIGPCHFSRDHIGAMVNGFVRIPSGDERALQAAVATIGPVSVAIDASSRRFQDYTSGVYVEDDCSSEKLDHAVLVVGYGTENGIDYWLVKNSWGAMWGHEGYIKMARNRRNHCGIATHAAYPTV